ncbi:MAG: GerW family sporulation protein [Methylocystaceae bacterium]
MAEIKNPLEDLMKTVMDGIKSMVDVTTVVGEPVRAGEETLIIPVSQVKVGFAAGGGEYNTVAKTDKLPFGGGSGAGVTVKPVGFLVVHNDDVRMLSVDGHSNLAEKLVDVAPVLADKLKQAMNSRSSQHKTSGCCPEPNPEANC